MLNSRKKAELCTDLQNFVESRQKLEGQKQENIGVQTVCKAFKTAEPIEGCGREPVTANEDQEFERLGEDETIYKLVGPVLLKQEKVEAESTVKGRLDFISGEMFVQFWRYSVMVSLMLT